MERKEHDLMMNVIANPDFTLDDFAIIGFNTDNTSIQDINTYRNNPTIQKQFTDEEGRFNEKEFLDKYNNATLAYNIMADKEFAKRQEQQVSYHRDNIFAPKEQVRTGPDFRQVIVPNPDRITSNIYKLGEVGPRTKSRDEIAQTSNVLLNPQEVARGGKPKWGVAPNDSFTDYFFDTLVMAQWDEDGVHNDPITGEQVQHKKGELKLNDEGTYYYEKLDGRDIYGRQVLNKMNVLTTDGSFWNRYDIFDEDDINQKSVGGTVMKNLALVGTMFLPYVGPAATVASLVPQLVGLTGTLGKMLSSSESPVFSELEGWSRSLNRQTAKTEYAQEHTWCWENFIGLIGDVAGQLKEQRFIFEKVPALFKGGYAGSDKAYKAKLASFEQEQRQITNTKISNLYKDLNLSNPQNKERIAKMADELYSTDALRAQAVMDSWMKGYNKIGEILSKGYMTAITVQDAYGEAKLAGASDLDATLLTLGYAAGEYAILNTAIGEWILPELRAARIKNRAIINTVRQIPKETESLYKQFGAELSSIPKEGKKEYVKKLFNLGKNIAKAEYVAGADVMKATLAAGAGEGVEEVSEELLADFSKGCFNAVKWLRGDDTRLNSFGFKWEDGNVSWDSKDLLDRYGMSLIGGAIGGSLTNLGTNYRVNRNLSNMSYEQAIQEIVYMSRNNQLDGLYKTLDKMEISNKNLSFETQEVNGKTTIKPGTATNNQDIITKDIIRRQIKIIDNIQKANGAKLSDESFLDKQTLNDLRYAQLHKAATAGLFLQEFNTLSTKLVQLTKTINDTLDSAADTNNDKVVTDREARRAKLDSTKQATLKEAEDNLAKVQQQIKDFIDGKRADEFIGITLFEMTPSLSGNLIPVTFPLYAEQVAGKKYSELSEKEKEAIRITYNNWKSTEGKDKIRIAAEIYRRMAEQSSSVINKQGQTYSTQSKEIQDINNSVLSLYDGINQLENNQDWLTLAQTLTDSISIGTKILSEQDRQQISNTLKSEIDNYKNITDPQLRAQKETELKALIKEQLSNVLINTVDNYIVPFIQQGFANVETKNQLKRVLRIAQEYISKKSYEYEQKLDIGEEIDPNPWRAKEIELSNLEEQIDTLNNTPFEQNYNQFRISIGENPINITELLEKLNNLFNKNSTHIQDFSISQDALLELENAIATMEMYRASILGARTDQAQQGDLFGYNATLNEVSKKLGKETNLAEISSYFADILVADIDTNLNKLKFLRDLYNVNSGQKLAKQERVAVKTGSLLYKGLRKIINIPNDDELRQLEGFQEFDTVLSSLSLLSDLSNNKLDYSLDKEQKVQFETEKLKMEDALYDFIQKNLDSQKLQLIISKFDVYTQSQELLNEGLQELDGPSMIWYIAARGAVKASDFYSLYKEILDPKSKIAPIATQEMAIYNNYASIVNGNVISMFHQAYRQHIKDDWKDTKNHPNIVDYRKSVLEKIGNKSADVLSQDQFADYCFNFLPVPRYSNVTLVEGIAGAGKSEAVIRATAQLLAYHSGILDNVAVVHAANGESAVKLKENCGIEGKTFDHDSFLKEVIVNYKPYQYDSNGVCKVTENDYRLSPENEYVGNLQIKRTNPFSLIIIDEVSKFNTYEMDAINQYAKEHGITVITAGDFDQIGVIGSHSLTMAGQKMENYELSLERNQFPRPPKLGVSMRTDNTIKTNNLSYYQTFMTKNDFSQELKLFYYEDESGLYGDKVFTLGDIEEIKAQVDRLIKTLREGEKKIGYIYKDAKSPLYKYLTETEGVKEYIDLKQGGTAQGLEGQYYIVDQSITVLNPQNQKEFNREVYTGMSRATQGSIIIVPETGTSIISDSTGQLIKEPLPQSVITQFTETKKAILNNIVKGQAPEYKARNKSVDQIEDRTTESLDEPPAVKETSNNAAVPTETPTAEATSNEQVAETIPSDIENSEVELSSEDDMPIQTVRNEQEYQVALNNASSDKESPQIEITRTEDNTPFDLDIFLYSFNTFELGVVVDEKGNILDDGDWSRVRIDSINGLRKIDALTGKTNQTLKDYIRRLGILRSKIFNATNKADLCRELNRLLGLEGLTIDFALKTTPVKTDRTKKSDSNYVGSPNKHGKNKNEKVIFNSSSDTRSSEIIPHSIVALIGNEETGDILELPLLTLTSPLTLARLTHKVDGVEVADFPDLKNIVDKYYATFVNGNPSDRTPDLHLVIQELKSVCDNNPQYKNIGNLIQLYQFSYGGLFRIKDSDWLPSKNLDNLGSQFTTKKGDLSIEKGFSFDSSSEASWINIAKYAKDSQIRVSSVMKSRLGTIDINGKPVKIVNPGHPFVLISYDTDLYTDQDIIDQYCLQQQQGYNGINKVRLQYILPPSIDIPTYLNYLEQVFFGDKNNRKNLTPLGNSFTPYTILKNVIKDEHFLNLVEKRLPQHQTFLNYLKKVIVDYDKGDNTELDRALKNKVPLGVNADGTESKQKVQLGTYFARMLLAVAYNKTAPTLDSNSKPVLTPDQNVINYIKEALEKENKTILYDIKPDHDLGPFMVCKVDDNWNIDGKACRINGKIDSYMFQGNIGSIIQEWVDQIHEESTQNGKIVLRSNDSYKLPNHKPTKPTAEFEQLTNVLNKLINLNDSRINEIVSSIKVTDTFTQLDETLNDIVSKINSIGIFSVKVGNDIMIAQNEIFKDAQAVYITANNQAITEIIPDNFGQATINVSVWNKDGSTIVYEGVTYDNGTLLVNIPVKENISASLSVTDENFSAYINNLRSILTKINQNLEAEGKTLKQIPILMKILSGVIANPQDLMSKLRYSPRAAALYQQVLASETDPNMYTLIQELIAYNESKNPDRKVCPETRPIKLI